MFLKQTTRLYGHVFRRYHLINDEGDINKCNVHTNKNVKKPLIKALQQKHDGHTSFMGI